MPGGAFDNLSDIFEASINWPKRLAHEGPFHRRLFQRLGIRSVLDAACGPGHHAALFHEWGLNVQGADLSPAMIARAQANFGTKPGLEWVERGYDTPVGQIFDAAICVGNSLALAPDRATAARAVGSLMAAVRHALVIHMANPWSWPDGPCVWQRCARMPLPEGPAVVVKGVHRAGMRAFIEVLVITGEGAPKVRSENMPLLALEADELESMARAAGAKRVTLFGGYGDEPYERAASVDLIVVAEK